MKTAATFLLLQASLAFEWWPEDATARTVGAGSDETLPPADVWGDELPPATGLWPHFETGSGETPESKPAQASLTDVHGNNAVDPHGCLRPDLLSGAGRLHLQLTNPNDGREVNVDLAKAPSVFSPNAVVSRGKTLREIGVAEPALFTTFGVTDIRGSTDSDMGVDGLWSRVLGSDPWSDSAQPPAGNDVDAVLSFEPCVASGAGARSGTTSTSNSPVSGTVRIGGAMLDLSSTVTQGQAGGASGAGGGAPALLFAVAEAETPDVFGSSAGTHIDTNDYLPQPAVARSLRARASSAQAYTSAGGASAGAEFSRALSGKGGGGDAHEHVARWTNCYSNDPKQAVKLGVGIALGTSQFRHKYGSDLQRAVSGVAGVVARANLIYYKQLGVDLQVKRLHVAALDGGGAGDKRWDDPDKCDRRGVDIRANLRAFALWVTAGDGGGGNAWATGIGTWQLLDDCLRGASGSQTVGLAYLGALCGHYPVGVNWDYGSMSQWHTFAHELGHTLGAEHSFEEGQGRTGGIMDYGDGKKDGQYQFNTRHRKAQVCGTLDKAINADQCPAFTWLGSSQIKARHGKCLDASERNKNGGKVHMWDCNTLNPNQQWRYDAATLQIKSSDGRCLDASERNKNGGKVHMWDCNTSNQNQQWDYDSGTGQIKARHGKCLDASERNKNGGKVHIWDCNTSNQNQQWDLRSI